MADDTPLLTVAHIRQLQADLEADERLLAELPARIAAKRQRLEAARLFLPEGYDLTTPTAPAESARKNSETFQLSPPPQQTETTRIAMVAATLENAGRGLSHKELRERTNASTDDKWFYNAIQRLEQRHELVKWGGLLYSARVFRQMKDRGEKLPDMTMDVRRREGGSSQIVLEVLGKHPKGLTGPELKEALSAIPEAPKSIREHGQYIYNILATLMGSGAVTKRDGVYRLHKAKG